MFRLLTPNSSTVSRRGLLSPTNTHVFFVVTYAVHPEAHGHAYENGTRSDQADADVPDGRHGLRVVVGQPEPVEQRADAHQRHAEPVRPLRFFRHDQRHFVRGGFRRRRSSPGFLALRAWPAAPTRQSATTACVPLPCAALFAAAALDT